ncbi:MAG: ABC transporter permease [Dehalococcoidia bacterium]|nr:ABC transporter permease [Dehalococcoidia bacterium]MCA9855748.1 ABC transporter permease [Dehalococcoidia bacterium]MCB9482517.1 ABC transporter permease [Dehalococcoidia bacterium]MCB9491333.1 ABC transporter permease [Dehalococcoidia bacterium]
MVKYITRRIVGLIPTLMILLFLVVVMVELIPGDIIDLILEEKFSQNDEARIVLEHELGLDRPLVVRYFAYVGGVVKGDLGHSLWTDQPVAGMIVQRALPTIEIGVLSILIGAAIGILIGTISAVRQDSFLDYGLRSVAILGLSVPNFALATAYVVFPAIWWGVAPNMRYVGFTEAPVEHLKIIIPPAIILGISLSATLMRLMRTTMLNELRQDYVRTAHSKGLLFRSVVIKHVLKNALIPVITLLGLQIAFLIGGSVITESVFAIPGVGRLLLSSIANRDYPVIQGIVVIIGMFVITTNLLIDLSYAWLDPRIRYS